MLGWLLNRGLFNHSFPQLLQNSENEPLQNAPQTRNAKNPLLNRPSKYKRPGACTWKIALKYKVKQSKNGKFTSNNKASPIDFETQISPRI